MTNTYRQVQRALSAQARAAGASPTCAASGAGVDNARAATEMMTAHTAYQAALRTATSIPQRSLLDFLK
jgi:flagellin-like hook-associated protein FlgL